MLLAVLLFLFIVSTIDVSGTVPHAAPNISAVNVNDSDFDGNIELYWNASGDADRYLIFRAIINISNVSLNVTLIGNVTGRFFEDNTSNHNQTYFYAIQPANDTDGANATVFTTNLNATANDSFAPKSPTGAGVVSVNSGSLRLSWNRVSLDNNSNVDTNVTYFIFRSTSTGINTSNFSRAIGNTTELNYTDEGLSSSTTYYYALAARDEALNYNDGMSIFNSTLINNSWREFTIAGFPAYKNVSGHAVVKSNITNLVYVFGGYAGDAAAYLRDFYAVNITNRTLSANHTSTSPTEAPGVRGYGALAFDPENNSIFHFGGFNGSYFAELWQYNLGNSTWVNRSYGNFSRFDPLAGWIYPQMAYRNIDNALYLVGGYNSAGNSVNFWYVFNITANNWTSITVTAATGGIIGNVTNRYAHNLLYVPRTAQRAEDYLFMFGGIEIRQGADPVTNNTFLYNFTSGNWTQLFMFQGAAPAPRDFASMAYGDSSDIAVLSGGRNATTGRDDMNTTWIFNFTTMTWNLSTVANTSKTSFGGQMVDPPALDREWEGNFLMIGGEILAGLTESVRDASIFEWLDSTIHGIMILLQDGTSGRTSDPPGNTNSGGTSSSSSSSGAGGGSSDGSSPSSPSESPAPSTPTETSSSPPPAETAVSAPPAPQEEKASVENPSIILVGESSEAELEKLNIDKDELLNRPPFLFAPVPAPSDLIYYTFFQIENTESSIAGEMPGPRSEFPLPPSSGYTTFFPLSEPDEWGNFAYIIGSEPASENEEVPPPAIPTESGLEIKVGEYTFIMVLPSEGPEMITYTFLSFSPDTEATIEDEDLAWTTIEFEEKKERKEEIEIPGTIEESLEKESPAVPPPIIPSPELPEPSEALLHEGEVEVKIQSEEELKAESADPVATEGITVITQYGVDKLEFQNPETGEWIKAEEGTTVPGGTKIINDPDSATLVKVPGIGLVEILPFADFMLTKEGIEEALEDGVAIKREVQVEKAEIGFMGEVSYIDPETGEKVIVHDFQQDKAIPATVEIYTEERSWINVPGYGKFIAEEGKHFTLTPEGLEQALKEGTIKMISDYRVPAEPIPISGAIRVEEMDTEVSYNHPQTDKSFTIVENDGRVIPAGAEFYTGKYGETTLFLPGIGLVSFDPQQKITLDEEHIYQAIDEHKAVIVPQTIADGVRVADADVPLEYSHPAGEERMAAEERLVPANAVIHTPDTKTVVEIGGIGYVELAPNSDIEVTASGIEEAKREGTLKVIDMSTIGVYQAGLGISYVTEENDYGFAKGGETIPGGLTVSPRVGDMFYVPYFGLLRVAKMQPYSSGRPDDLMNPRITFDYSGIKQALDEGYLEVQTEISGFVDTVRVINKGEGSPLRYREPDSTEWQEVTAESIIPLGSILSNEKGQRVELFVPGVGIIMVSDAAELRLTRESIEALMKTFDVFLRIDLRPKSKEQSSLPTAEGKKFALSTEISLAAAKGTHFWNRYDAKNKVSIIGVYEGTVEVVNTETGEVAVVAPQEDGRPGIVVIKGKEERFPWSTMFSGIVTAIIILAGIIAWRKHARRRKK